MNLGDASKPFSILFVENLLFDEFCGVPLKSLLANQAAEMVGFTFIGDFEFSCVFIKNHAADWVSKHYGSLNLKEQSTCCLLWVVVRKASSTL